MSASLYGSDFFAGRSLMVQQSAAVVVPVLMELCAPYTVLDVGAGQGEWMDAFEEFEGVTCFGLDIAAPPTSGLHGRILHADLTKPVNLNCHYDLVLCLETGEHLPEESADTLIDTIVRHADEFIVFGAAVPGQEGTGHINCQPHEYWHAKFEDRGYTTEDVVRPLIANDGRVSPWYRNNMFLYRRPS